jgi:hypothetical protein
VIVDDHAKQVAEVFHLVHRIKFRVSKRTAGVLILYTDKSATPDMLSEVTVSEALLHTLFTSTTLTLPFQLPITSLLSDFVDTAGRACEYTIFWAPSGRQLRVLADCSRKKLQTSFSSESYGVHLETSSIDPVAEVFRTRKRMAVRDAPEAVGFRRSRLAADFGIKDVILVPMAGGVLEYGIALTVLDAAKKEIARFVASQVEIR